jgi:hypothetical protein
MYNINKIPCRGCSKTRQEHIDVIVEERHDYYGISTGYWCDDCFENKYPYRRDAYYDYLNAGEYLNDDY